MTLSKLEIMKKVVLMGFFQKHRRLFHQINFQHPLRKRRVEHIDYDPFLQIERQKLDLIRE